MYIPNVLDSLSSVDPGCLEVEGTIRLGERCAFRKRDADATRVVPLDGGCNREESKSDSDERGFAEHTEAEVTEQALTALHSNSVPDESSVPEERALAVLRWPRRYAHFFIYISRIASKSVL